MFVTAFSSFLQRTSITARSTAKTFVTHRVDSHIWASQRQVLVLHLYCSCAPPEAGSTHPLQMWLL